VEEAAESGQVFFVLGEEHGDEAIRRNETDETTLAVDHRQCGLLSSHRTPGGDLLIDSRRHDRRVAIDEVPDEPVRRRDEEILESEEAHEPLLVACDDVTGAVVSALLQSVTNVRHPVCWREHRNLSRRVGTGRVRPTARTWHIGRYLGHPILRAPAHEAVDSGTRSASLLSRQAREPIPDEWPRVRSLLRDVIVGVRGSA
jgi:hypothetical protein